MAAILPAGAEPPQKLYVTNSAGDDIHVIDAATSRVIRRLVVGPEPHGIAAPAAQNVIFVSLENMKGAAGELLWLDPATDTVTKRIAIGPRPNQLACTPDGKTCYVSERETNQVAVVDTATKRVLAHIPVGKVPKRVLVVTAPVEFTFSNFQKPKDSGRARIEDGKAIITLSSSDGIGGVTVTTKKGLWPRDVTVLIEGIGNLERFAVTTDRLWAQGSLKQSGWAELSLRNAKGEFEKYDPTGPFIRAGSLDVRVEKRKEGMAIVFPANLFADTGSVSIGWIDAWRR